MDVRFGTEFVDPHTFPINQQNSKQCIDERRGEATEGNKITGKCIYALFHRYLKKKKTNELDEEN